MLPVRVGEVAVAVRNSAGDGAGGDEGEAGVAARVGLHAGQLAEVVCPWPKPEGSAVGLAKNWTVNVEFGVLFRVPMTAVEGRRGRGRGEDRIVLEEVRPDVRAAGGVGGDAEGSSAPPTRSIPISVLKPIVSSMKASERCPFDDAVADIAQGRVAEASVPMDFPSTRSIVGAPRAGRNPGAAPARAEAPFAEITSEPATNPADWEADRPAARDPGETIAQGRLPADVGADEIAASKQADARCR